MQTVEVADGDRVRRVERAKTVGDAHGMDAAGETCAEKA
jgi:hypothetical protein